jgi:hypothetical protein
MAYNYEIIQYFAPDFTCHCLRASKYATKKPLRIMRLKIKGKSIAKGQNINNTFIIYIN